MTEIWSQNEMQYVITTQPCKNYANIITVLQGT